MLRVVDAPAAIAARGFPAATSLSVPLDIADGALPANAGRWELTVAEGKGALNPLTPRPPAGPPLALGPARPGRAVRRYPGRHAAPGRPGLGRLGRR